MVKLRSEILRAGVDIYSDFNQETTLTAACPFDSSPHSPGSGFLYSSKRNLNLNTDIWYE